MRKGFVPSCVCLLCCCCYVAGAEQGVIAGQVVNTNSYSKASIDVKDGDQKSGNDSLYIEGLLWDRLRDVGIAVVLSDKEKADAGLHVICTFSHGLGKPVITPGFQIKSSFIAHCTVKFTDKSGRVLFEMSWEKSKKAGDVEDFIKIACKKFMEQLDTKPPSSLQPQPASTATNAVSRHLPKGTTN